MRGSLRKFLLILLVVVVVATLVYRSRGAITLEGFSWARLMEAVREASPLPLLFSLAAIYVCYAVRALRWVRLSRHIGAATFGNVYPATLIGFAAIFLLGRAGEPIRPLLIARKDRLPVSATFGIYVLERLFDMASTVVLAGVSLLVFPRVILGAQEGDPRLAWARTAGLLMILGLASAVSFLVYFRLHGAGALARRLESWRADPARTNWRHRVARLFSGFSEGLQAIRSFTDLGEAVLYSALHWLLVAYIYLWVAGAFGGRLAQLDLPSAMLVLVFTMVGSAVQLPAVGGGSQAACFLAFTLVFGVDNEPAAAASIVLWLITFAGSTIAGVPLLIREGWSMGELRRLAREEAAAGAAGTHISVGSGGAGDTSR